MHPSRPKNLLAISGSLRAASSNTALLEAAKAVAPRHINVDLYSHLGDLPHFNPDIEHAESEAVADLKTKVEAADGLIISSPEYAHGIPGSLKNALDWLVGGHEFVKKPVVFFHTSTRGMYAQEALREVVKTMSGNIIEQACTTLPLLGKHLSAKDIEADAELSSRLSEAIEVFDYAIDSGSVC